MIDRLCAEALARGAKLLYLSYEQPATRFPRLEVTGTIVEQAHALGQLCQIIRKVIFC
ncbi:MAG: hypothetical protein JO334_13860 [Verrucomicrobia bacterium]|nr:hypothetical protein [Verrucomicrobiota bacterium]